MTKKEEIIKKIQDGEWGGLDLNCADLSDADLSRTDLSGADLICADLSYANLSCAYLRGADLRGANLSRARADLSDICYNERTAFLSLCCPEEGSFVGYKKCQDDKIVKLLITEDAKRSSATTRKCRESKVKVLSIEKVDGTKSYDEAVSIHSNSFIYLVGQVIEVKDFDEDRWKECATGIHFFITRDEAVRYNF